MAIYNKSGVVFVEFQLADVCYFLKSGILEH